MAWREILITGQGDGGAVTAAAATSLLTSGMANAKRTLSPNFFDVIGKRLHIHAAGKISSVITTPGTARFDVRLGATVVFDGQAVLLDAAAAHTNVGWTLDIWLTLRAVGATANFIGHGEFRSEVVKGSGTMPLGSLVAMLPWNATPAVGNNFDATVSQQLDFFFTQTVATGSITLQQYELDCLHTE
jgi:hypothetical protein